MAKMEPFEIIDTYKCELKYNPTDAFSPVWLFDRKDKSKMEFYKAKSKVNF
jgi:hypothetical protein